MRILEEFVHYLINLTLSGKAGFAVSFYKRVFLTQYITTDKTVIVIHLLDTLTSVFSNSLRIILVILVIFTYLYVTTVKTREKQYYGGKFLLGILLNRVVSRIRIISNSAYPRTTDGIQQHYC